ncbi:TatD family nuclease-associated radical SAM protein [Methanosalsum natronophilum]|uniref:TatD family nuclease-associated radical SAM protein n=1 Tax=Methanosalsum natronophilum TaxID=768733 RepID=UPI002169E6E8|nr:TatD family nuclease-associated radical SAM protein [Methanosalsum natronophilum]MCS3924596.1 TatD family-associated radical SAM protein [Methanosalsum natronophilum]
MNYKSNERSGAITYPAHGNIYLNITNRCTAECTFCIREVSNGVYGYNLTLDNEPTVQEIIKELENHNLKAYKEIVFTGFGEPLIRLDTVIEITKWLKKKGHTVRLDTNGHAKILYPTRNVPLELKEAGIDAVSVSMNAESKEIYNRICRPYHPNAYDSMLEFVKRSVKYGIKTRVTVVNMDEIDINACEMKAHELGAEFYVR